MVSVALALIGIIGCSAQLNSQPTFTPQNLTMQDEHVARQHKWANLPWTGNNAPYQQVRQEMESADAAGRDMETLRVKYGLLAQQNPKDALAQFRWAYASALSIKPTTGGGKAQGNMFGVAEALARVPSPQTYDYLREQFLIEAWHDRPTGLERLGERLLQRSPHDYPVQCAYVRVLHWSLMPEKRQKALTLAQALIKEYPQKLNPYTLLAGVYTQMYWQTHNKDDAQKALAASQEYLRRAPANFANRQNVILVMKMIKDELAKHN